MRSTAARFALPAAVAILAMLAVVTAAPVAAQAQDGGNATTTFGFDIGADGDARVVVTTSLPLKDDSDQAAFDRLATEHTGETASPLSMEPFERAVGRTATAAGRPMEIRDVDWTASRTNTTGQLALSFTWTNFAGVEEDRLLVDEAFRTADGTWLPGLGEDQELVISFPDGYSPQSISTPGARYQLVNGTVYVQGPASFESGTPSVVLVQTGNPSPPPWDLLSAVAVVVVILVLLAIVFRDRLRSLGRRAGADDEPIEREPDAAGDPDPMAEPLLSDEERVVKLLESRDGRMKQVEIVEATDWSNAKVSQLLSEMDEAGRVDKLRIGRENLISLPGQGPGNE